MPAFKIQFFLRGYELIISKISVWPGVNRKWGIFVSCCSAFETHIAGQHPLKIISFAKYPQVEKWPFLLLQSEQDNKQLRTMMMVIGMSELPLVWSLSVCHARCKVTSVPHLISSTALWSTEGYYPDAEVPHLFREALSDPNPTPSPQVQYSLCFEPSGHLTSVLSVFLPHSLKWLDLISCPWEQTPCLIQYLYPKGLAHSRHLVPIYWMNWRKPWASYLIALSFFFPL